MAKQIIWTKPAQASRKEILQYWVDRNKSTAYSKKLQHLFKEHTSLLKYHPFIGIKSDVDDVRILFVRDYLVYYSVAEEAIYILNVWDSRRLP